MSPSVSPDTRAPTWSMLSSDGLPRCSLFFWLSASLTREPSNLAPGTPLVARFAMSRNTGSCVVADLRSSVGLELTCTTSGDVVALPDETEGEIDTGAGAAG